MLVDRYKCVALLDRLYLRNSITYGARVPWPGPFRKGRLKSKQQVVFTILSKFSDCLSGVEGGENRVAIDCRHFSFFGSFKDNHYTHVSLD